MTFIYDKNIHVFNFVMNSNDTIYISFNLPNKRITYCHDICNNMSPHGLFLCCSLSALRNESTANICRPYSYSNTEYIVTIRKRKISYFILHISMTLLVCRSIELNKC